MADSPFHPDIPKLQVAWDSVSMNALQSCPYYYKLTIIEGWQKKTQEVPLIFGQLFHRAMEDYFKLRQTKNHPEALEEVVLASMQLSRLMGLQDEQSDKDPRTRFTLIRSIVWYLDKFESSQASTLILKDGKPAVELSFRIAIPLEHSQGPYILCGHIDRVSIEADGTPFVNDYKTTVKTLNSYFFRNYDLDWQMSNYIFAAGVLLENPVKGARIDGIQVAQGFTRTDRAFTYRTTSQQDEWLQDTFKWIGMAERFAEEDHWPQNLRQCWACRMKEVCAKAPEVRSTWLKDEFEKRPWNPLENR